LSAKGGQRRQGGSKQTPRQSSSAGEETLALHLRSVKSPPFVREFKFHPVRRWRFDFAFPEQMVAVEVEGGAWNGGRHTRGSGFTADCEKYNAAALLGWRVFRFTVKQVESGEAIKTLEVALAPR